MVDTVNVSSDAMERAEQSGYKLRLVNPVPPRRARCKLKSGNRPMATVFVGIKGQMLGFYACDECLAMLRDEINDYLKTKFDKPTEELKADLAAAAIADGQGEGWGTGGE